MSTIPAPIPFSPTRKEAVESTLRAVGMFLLVVDSKRRDHFVNWTHETTQILEGMRESIREALAMPETAERPTPADADRASFQRETLERHDHDQVEGMGGYW